MLKEIKDILKTMGEALSFAHTGEMLSINQKTTALNHSKKATLIAVNSTPSRDVLADVEELFPRCSGTHHRTLLGKQG